MSREIIIQFVGFESKAGVREYTFTVREPSADLREFTVTIANEAFDDHRARFQDAPDICSLKLRRELAAAADRPLLSHFKITDEDLEAYRTTHSPRPSRFAYGRKPAEED